jgi:hypothetical protein
MSFLATIPIIGKVLDGAIEIIDKSVTDKDLKNKLNNEIKKIRLQAEDKLLDRAHAEIQGQIEINKEEAKSKSVFVAGWRPFIGWVCGIAFAFNFIIVPLFPWLMTMAAIWFPEAAKLKQPGPLSLAELTPVLMGILGLGGYRTFEKTKGVANK